jgi:serine/threonine protein phosphatase 1
MTKFREIEEIPARLFVVGDIHGCAEELNIMLAHLEANESLSDDDLIVFIGDYIDRGPSSKEVVDSLIAFHSRYPQTIFLRGNHEDMLLDFLGYEGTLGHSYLVNGGQATTQSYGCLPAPKREQLGAAIPTSHLAFFLNLERYIIVGDYVIVHAGLNPLRDVRSQLNEDIFWIRDEFIQNIHNFGRIVVFGHTPYEDVLVHPPYKIGIDTGLVYGNLLSVVELTNRRVFQIKRGAKEVTVKSFGI